MWTWKIIQHSICRYRFGLTLYLWLLFVSTLHSSWLFQPFSESSVKLGAAAWAGIVLYWVMKRTHVKWDTNQAQTWHTNTCAYSILAVYFLYVIFVTTVWPGANASLSVFIAGAFVPLSAVVLIGARKTRSDLSKGGPVADADNNQAGARKL